MLEPSVHSSCGLIKDTVEMKKQDTYWYAQKIHLENQKKLISLAQEYHVFFFIDFIKKAPTAVKKQTQTRKLKQSKNAINSACSLIIFPKA